MAPLNDAPPTLKLLPVDTPVAAHVNPLIRPAVYLHCDFWWKVAFAVLAGLFFLCSLKADLKFSCWVFDSFG